MDNKMITGIMGPTASGKTKLAVALAEKEGSAIVSMDSRQVYKHLNIGAGKDLIEYGSVDHYLIDHIDLEEEYHIDRFKKDFHSSYQHIIEKKQSVIACGGTGLYFDVLLNDRTFTSIPVDEKLRSELEKEDHEYLKEKFSRIRNSSQLNTDTSTKKRTIRAIEIAEYLKSNSVKSLHINYTWKLFCIDIPVDIRTKRIDERLSERLKQGLIGEVESILNSGVSAERLIKLGLEYKWITHYLMGEISKEESIEKLRISIHQFAKRQMTFFRKIQKDGHRIQWLDGELSTSKLLEEILKDKH